MAAAAEEAGSPTPVAETGTPTSTPLAASTLGIEPTTIALRDWRYVVTGIVWDPVISDASGALLPPDGRYVFVEFDLMNLREEQSSVNPWNFEIRDEANRLSFTAIWHDDCPGCNPTYAVAYGRGPSAFDVTLDPGQTVATGILFDVSIYATKLRMSFYGGMFAEDRWLPLGAVPASGSEGDRPESDASSGCLTSEQETYVNDLGTASGYVAVGLEVMIEAREELLGDPALLLDSNWMAEMMSGLAMISLGAGMYRELEPPPGF